jgi:hypothetical protein
MLRGRASPWYPGGAEYDSLMAKKRMDEHSSLGNIGLRRTVGKFGKFGTTTAWGKFGTTTACTRPGRGRSAPSSVDAKASKF